MKKLNESKLNFSALAKVMEKIDDNGKSGRCGNWEMGLGGYDHGYEIYYKGTPVARVNYGFKEYELYHDGFITRETLPEFLKAIDAVGFKNIHEKDTGPYKEGDWVIWHDQEWYIDDGWFDDEDRHYLYTIKQLNGHKMDAVPEEELASSDKDDTEVVEESSSLKMITDRYSAEQRTALDGKTWWVFFNNETGKYIPSAKYKTKRECENEIILAMKYGRLDATPEELEKIKSLFAGLKMEESTNWEELEKGMKWNLEIRNRRELDGLYGLIHRASLKFDDAQKWVDKLDEFYDSSDKNWELEINGKKELDTLYALVRAGATSMTDDKVAIKWRNRLSKFYAEFNKMNESTRKTTMKKIVKESSELEQFLINKEKEFKPSRVNPSWDESEDKVWAVQEYLSQMGEFTDEDREFLKHTDPEMLSLEDEPMEESKKVVDEADEDVDMGEPKIYVGTYAKYNNGSIDGKWITISDYNTYEEFVDACRELHSDEDDPEFMVQDYENFPEKWYHEGGLPTEEEFDKINEYYMMDDNRKEAYEVFVNHTGLDSIEDFEEAYEGEFSSSEDFAYNIVDSFGFDGLGENIETYFDYDSFGRDLMYDFHQGDEDNTDAEGNPEDPDHYYDNEGYDMGEYESDEQVAYDYIDNLGGFDALGKETAQRYFDYEAFGRDLLINDYWEDDGYVFRNI